VRNKKRKSMIEKPAPETRPEGSSHDFPVVAGCSGGGGG
jgi:hypothetical protein